MKKGLKGEAFILPHIREMEAYRPGKQPEGDGWIKLNTNENPYPPSPGVEAAVRAECKRLPLYPNSESGALRKAIAHYHGVGSDQVMVGNGSDELLSLLARSFCGTGKKAGMMDPSYSLYPVLAAIQNSTMLRVPFDRGMEFHPEKVIRSETNLFFLASPNAPTGISVSRAAMAEVLDHYHGLLVVDEAYASFAEEDAIPLLQEYRNCVVLRTFSKSHGLAGLRLGYAMASPGVISFLDRIKDSYNVNRLSQAGALSALGDRSYYREVIEKVKTTREFFRRELESREWFTYPSQANFLFTEPVNGKGRRGPEVARNLFAALERDKILVRYFGENPLTAGFLRISVGRDSEMKLLLERIDSWRESASER